MSLILFMAGSLLLAMAVAGTVYGAASAVLTARFLGRTPAAPGEAEPLTILRPMKGLDPEAEANLRSLVEQDYPGPVQIILGADSEADPAVAAACALQAAFPARDICVVTDATLHGTNRKLGNLINMTPRITGEIVVVSDSDVRLPQAGLSALVGALQQPGVGLVYGLYRGRPAGNLWSRIAALDINTRFAANVLVGQALGSHPVLGPTMALRRETLERAGGFERLRDVLADDFELGRMVRELDLSIACPPILIDHLFPERSLGELWAHELRWARTIRLLNPGGYAGSVITYALPLALVGAGLTGFAAWASALLLGLTVLRLIQSLVLCAVMRADRRAIWLFALRDLLAFGVFLAAYFGDRIEWRGNRLRVQADGAMASQ